MVNYPAIVIMLGIMVISIFLGAKKLLPFWIMPVGFLFSFIAAWLYWSIVITKWRIWAFENVSNVHDLKKKAIQHKLIWKDGSIFEKTEIRTQRDKEKLIELVSKFEKQDSFKEDFSIPRKTEIYFSKSTNFIELIVSIGIIAVGFYLINIGTTGGYVIGAVMLLIGLFSSSKHFKRFSNSEPQIIIDKNGIQTGPNEIYNWSEISNEEVIIEGYGKSAKSYLIFNFGDNEYEKILIEDLNISNFDLENAIRTHRIRNNKNYR